MQGSDKFFCIAEPTSVCKCSDLCFFHTANIFVFDDNWSYWLNVFFLNTPVLLFCGKNCDKISFQSTTEALVAKNYFIAFY